MVASRESRTSHPLLESGSTRRAMNKTNHLAVASDLIPPSSGPNKLDSFVNFLAA